MDESVAALIARLADASLYTSEKDADMADRFSQELLAIQSIYGEDELELQESPDDASNQDTRLLLRVSLPMVDVEVVVRILIQLPPGYPDADVAPKFKLLNKYIGRFGADASVQQFVDSVFQPESECEVEWVRGEAMLFEGIETLTEYIRNWYDTKSQDQAPTKEAPSEATPTTIPKEKEPSYDTPASIRSVQIDPSAIVRSESIVERKSEFLGHAIRITHPDQVPLFLSHIVDTDKRVQRATHPIIHAWVCKTEDGVLHHGAYLT